MLEVQGDNSYRPGLPPGGERPHLGLVCITASDEVRFRTITRTRFLKLGEVERYDTLKDLYSDNLRRLHKALNFCAQRQIRLYRMSSGLFPMSDLPEDATGANILEEMKDELAEIGKWASRYRIRVVVHPEQFVVLNSENPRVVETSI